MHVHLYSCTYIVYIFMHTCTQRRSYLHMSIAKLQLASKYIVQYAVKTTLIYIIYIIILLLYSIMLYILYTYYIIMLSISKALCALIISVCTTIHQRQMCDCVCIYFKSAAAPCSLCEHLKWWHRSWNRVA